MSVARQTNVIGDVWESSVSEKWFPKEFYELLEKTHSDATLRQRMITSSRNPDFKFRDLVTGKVFFVECKYRGFIKDDKVIWTDYEHLKRYQLVKEPVFVALHLSLNDDRYYLMPLRLLSYPEIYMSKLKGYDRLLYPVCSGDLWRL
jgi:hypothetical protein